MIAVVVGQAAVLVGPLPVSDTMQHANCQYHNSSSVADRHLVLSLGDWTLGHDLRIATVLANPGRTYVKLILLNVLKRNCLKEKKMLCNYIVVAPITYTAACSQAATNNTVSLAVESWEGRTGKDHMHSTGIYLLTREQGIVISFFIGHHMDENSTGLE